MERNRIYGKTIIVLLMAFLTGAGEGWADDNTKEPSGCQQLETVMLRCDSLLRQDCFSEVQKLLGHELVSVSHFVDSCECSSYLFSLLALAYEHLGDTITPGYLHHKAQELAIGYEGITAGPDSTAIYRQRLETMRSFIAQAEPQFSRSNLGYLEMLSSLVGWMYHCGNMLEVINLGETVQKIANDSLVSDDPVLDGLYGQMLCAYAWEDRMEQMEQLLPVALAFYRKHPQLNITDATLYLLIGEHILDRHDEKGALPYLLKAKATETDLKSERYQVTLDLIRQCKDKSSRP